MSKNDQEVTNTTEFNLEKNNTIQCRPYVELDTVSTAVNLQESCAATVDMLPGDQVYVRCGNIHVITSAVQYNEFTGFLINPTL